MFNNHLRWRRLILPMNYKGKNKKISQAYQLILNNDLQIELTSRNALLASIAPPDE